MMRQGYTFVSSAWDAVSGTRPDVGGGPFVLDAPIALNPDGSEVVGPSLEEFVIDDDKTSVEPLTYPAASLDPAKAVLTFRAEVKDKPISVAADQWRYNAAGTTVSLLPEGTKFKSGMLYELVYPARIRLLPDWASQPPATLLPFSVTPMPTTRQSQSPRGRVAAGLYDLHIAGLSVHARLRCARVQRGRRHGAPGKRGPIGPQGRGRRPELGRRRERHISQLSLRSAIPHPSAAYRPMVSRISIPVRVSDHDGFCNRQDGWVAATLQRERNLPEDH